MCIRGDGLHLFLRTFQQADSRLHLQHLPLCFGLAVGSDKNALFCPQGTKTVGAQLKTLTPRLFLVIDQMPQIQLAFAAVFGAELDVLFAPFILQAQFVVRRSAQYVAFVVADGDVVAVRRVVQHIGDIRPVRVAVLKCNRHFGAGQQRQVQAVGVTRIRSSLTNPQAFVTRLPTVTVEHQVDTVAPVFVDMTISVVRSGTGHPRRQGPGHGRLADQRRTEAILFGIRNGFKMHFIAAVAAGVAGDAGDYHPFAKLCWHVVAGDFQFLTR
ncbi:Uncharacterised protein [Yersinia intermedia]|nr:Uncharacterised protein [Yersinia intermedia]